MLWNQTGLVQVEPQPLTSCVSWGSHLISLGSCLPPVQRTQSEEDRVGGHRAPSLAPGAPPERKPCTRPGHRLQTARRSAAPGAQTGLFGDSGRCG